VPGGFAENKEGAGMHGRRSVGLCHGIWQETGTVMVMTIQLYHFWPGDSNFFSAHLSGPWIGRLDTVSAIPL
jgi:hypothetical protein